MAGPARAQTSAGQPSPKPKPAPTNGPPAASSASRGVKTAQVSGAPKVSLANPEAAAAKVGGKLAPDEIDLSTGTLAIPEATAATVEEGKDLDVKVRLPGLAEGSIKVRKGKTGFNTVGSAQAILLRHPALLTFSASNPTMLALQVKESQVTGWVGLGLPGQAKGNTRSLFESMAKASDLVGWAGLSKISLPIVRNKFEGGVIDVGVDNLSFTVGGWLTGTASAALDNSALSFDGSAKVTVGPASGELGIKKDATGALSGKLDLQVAFGKVSGSVTATLVNGFVSVMGTVGYSGDRLSGKLTIVATDEATARDVTLLKPTGGDVPFELPSPDKPPKPGKRAWCGWGTLDFRVTEWLTGSATVICNSKGDVTIVGEIAPPKEFILFEQKEWIKKLFGLEIKAGYGIPVVGQVGVYASIQLDAVAKIGPGKLYNIKLQGAYSTDPRVPKNLSIEGTLNISAFAGLRLRAEAGMFVTILGHDIKVGVGLNAIAGVRGYVEATPRIGMRELAPGQRQYYIQGHLEIAAQPVLGFSGDLFVKIETPWWSPLSDKTWTWPLFEIEYPLPGEFGIGADVDYVLGSKQWPKIEFGEVAFDSSKFMTDVMNDNTDKGSGKEEKKPGDWQEGLGGGGPGGAKNKGGKGKSAGDMDDDIGPIGEEESFSDGKESHRVWFEQKESNATLMMASSTPGPVEKQLAKWDTQVEMLAETDQKRARTLINQARRQLQGIDKEADQVAIMKVATKRAKEMYEKSKKKKGNKVKKGKNGAKELNKLIRQHQRTLKDTLVALSILMYEVPFKQIKETGEMWGSGKETVRTVNRSKHAGLEVAGREGSKEFDKILNGPVGTAKNKAGRHLTTTTGTEVAKQAQKIEKAQIRRDQIKYFHVYEKLPPPTEAAAKKVGAFGTKMKIRKLDRALKIEPIPKSWLKHPILYFEASPKIPEDLAAEKHGLYQKTFFKEMDRQLGMQERGLNKLTVDEWIRNLMLFGMDAETFVKLDKSSRLEILETLNKRAKKALDRCKDRISRLVQEREDVVNKIAKSDKTMEELDQAITKATERFDRLELAQAEIDVAKAKNLGDVPVAPERDILAPKDPKTIGKRFERRISLRILGRMGGEGRVKRALGDYRTKLLKEIEEWQILTNGDITQLAVLHNPDQVAGGYDSWDKKKFPREPTNWKDLKQVAAFVKKLKQFYGPQVVNSEIGGRWSKLIRDTARPDVMKAVPQEAYGINRMNYKLQRKK